MSKYTTMLRFPVEQRLKDLGLTPDEVNWSNIYRFVGLEDYPIYDETHRQVLNDKIIRRYWMREIGFETMGLFRWHMRAKMHEIMPYYNELYKTVGLIEDPLSTRDMSYEEEWTRDESEKTSSMSTATSSVDGQTSSQSHSVTDVRTVFQDTPMNGLDTGAIANMDYASEVTFDDTTVDANSSGTSSSDTHSDENGSGTRDGDFEGTKTHREHGYDRPQAETLLTYRKAIRNIDLEIVDALSDMFMLLW